MNLPQEFYIIIGTLVVSKMDVIFSFIKSIIKREVDQARIDLELQTIHKTQAIHTQTLDKMQKDMNELFRRVKNG